MASWRRDGLVVKCVYQILEVLLWGQASWVDSVGVVGAGAIAARVRRGLSLLAMALLMLAGPFAGAGEVTLHTIKSKALGTDCKYTV